MRAWCFSMLESGIVWDKKTISAYVKKPRKFIPGNKMALSA